MRTFRLKPVFCHVSTIPKVYVRNLSGDTTTKISSPQLKPCSDIPGPSSWPVIGQTLHFLPGGELHNIDGTKLGGKLFKKYGPIVKLNGIFGRPDFIMLFDAESCAQVLRSENWLPIRPGIDSMVYYRRSKITDPKQNTGLISDQGEIWKQFRSTVNPVMLQPKTIQLYKDMLDDVAQDMVLRMKSIRGVNHMIQGDFDVEMNLWSLESIGLVALGRRLNCLDPNLPSDSPAKRLIQLIHETFIMTFELDFKPSMWRYYKTRKFKKAMDLYEEQTNIIKYFIDRTIDEMETQSAKKTDDEKSVLEKLLEIDKNVALIMASDMIFAGVDTSQLLFMHQAMSIVEDHYPRPNEYIPERWIVGKEDPLYHGNAHPFAYVPFGFGVRSCIGRRIAELEIETFLARIIENFKVEWFGPPIQVMPATLNYIKGPYNFLFKDI